VLEHDAFMLFSFQVVSEQLQQAQEEQMKVSRDRRRLKEELVRTKRELDAARLRLAEMEQEGPRQTAAWKEQEAKRHRQLLSAAMELQVRMEIFFKKKQSLLGLCWKGGFQQVSADALAVYIAAPQSLMDRWDSMERREPVQNDCELSVQGDCCHTRDCNLTKADPCTHFLRRK
jgi:chromosome segregation ATPase